MKILNEYSNIQEAYIDKGLLINNGINAEVQTDSMSDVFPAPGAGNGAIYLLVPDNDFDKACNLISGRK